MLAYYLTCLFYMGAGISLALICFTNYKTLRQKEKQEELHHILKPEESPVLKSNFRSGHALIMSIMGVIMALVAVAMLIKN